MTDGDTAASAAAPAAAAPAAAAPAAPAGSPSLSGLPEPVYARAVAAFTAAADPPSRLFLRGGLDVLEAAARAALASGDGGGGGDAFSSRRFAFFAPLALARWPAGLPLGGWDLLCGALYPGRALEGAAYAGLALHLLFPSARAGGLPPAALDAMVAASAPDDAPQEVTAELAAVLRRWAGVPPRDEAAAGGGGGGGGADEPLISREGFLNMTYELDEMTEALQEEELAAAAAAGEAPT